MGAACGGDQKENIAAGHAPGVNLPPKRHGRAVLAPLACNTLLSVDTPRTMLKPDAGHTPLSRSGMAPTTAQTPLSCSHLRTWASDLAAYVEGAPSGEERCKARAAREALAAAVQRSPDSPEAWWAFLSQEEAAGGTLTSCLGESTARPARSAVSLGQLYAWAVKAVPKTGNYGNEAYLRLWLGCARHQWAKSADDARDTLKMLRSQGIGEAAALLYAEWAQLECAAGARERAKQVARKGLAAGAHPAALLEALLADLDAGRQPAAIAHGPGSSSGGGAGGGGGGGATTHLGFSAATAFLPTPAAGAPTQRRLPPLTPTVELATERSATVPAVPQAEGGPGRTATPATGRTDASGSSRGSSADGDAETVNLQGAVPQPNPPPDAAAADAAAGVAAALDDPTVIVSRAPRPAFGRAFTSGPLGGPRRLGLGGGAARIAVEGERKRKADLPVAPRSPGAAAAVAAGASGAKRRSSPEAEAAAVAPGAHGGDLRLDPAATTAPAQPGSAAGQGAGGAADGLQAAGLPEGPREEEEDPDETVPLVNGGLARRALRGRQSIAPGGAEEVFVRRPGAALATAALAAGEGPTLSLPQAPGAGAGPGPSPAPDGHAVSAAGSAADPDQTLPISRPAAAAAGSRPSALPAPAGTPGSSTERPAVQRLVPPPPPPPFAARPPAPPAAEAPAHPVMGPPPSRPRPPLASLAGDAPALPAAPTAVPAAPVSGPGGVEGTAAAPTPRARRVREDENTVVVRGTRYTKLECVGRGGSSKVFKVMAPSRKIYALKRIRLAGRDREAAAGFIDEIALLNRLRGNANIIQLFDAEVIRGEGLIYMVMEYGDIDLARLLARHEAAQRVRGALEPDENFIRLYWQQMLQAVHTIHEARIVHSDLKPANFLVVEGRLKLIDFGIAKAISSDTTSIARESQVGTLNYMSPEAILGGATNIRGGPPMKVGRPSDIWSLGCILYQMVTGHTPFAALAFIQKMHAITDPAHSIDMPPLRNAALADVIRRCLDRNPRTRITMPELLEHPLLRPVAAPSVGDPDTALVGLSRAQLRRLLVQLKAASVAGAGADLDTVTEELFRQLSAGQTVNLARLLPSPQPPPAAAGAALAAAAALAPALSARPLQRAPLAPLGVSMQDIQAGRAALKRVVAPPAPAADAAAEGTLEARLREGLARFRFDDTAGTAAGDDTAAFSP
ncbi:hypothetical protein WJX81_004955 [Elliptochloris bilobata]|uniref:Protein kinase domain-containing protein n=1 Tax=Elliptochloris bilobata TaxID=381761 RepID=A0AAW1S8F8_9CHLO